MPIETWDEIRTAFHVARLGTVSGAAEKLGVHHATVIRHIDALETRLGVKLFQRHARGYTATEAGTDLLEVASGIAAQFEQLEGRLHGQSAKVTGELVVTSLEVFTPMVLPVLVEYQAQHPSLKIQLLTDPRLFRLEYGEAHVAIRAGKPADDPDYVVQFLATQQIGLYGTKAYVAEHGLIGPDLSTKGHVFVGSTEVESKAAFLVWLDETVPDEQIVFRCSDVRTSYDAVRAGVGAGFLPVCKAERDPDLVSLTPMTGQWDTPIWLVTHVDLHRTAKVHDLTVALKAAAKGWGPK